jgi:hypothetical protein
MISRVIAAFVFSLLTIGASSGWAEETYQGQVAGVGEVEVELVERGTPCVSPPSKVLWRQRLRLGAVLG